MVHAGFIKWFTNHTTPGYVLVSATDPTQVYLVTAIAGARTKAAPRAVAEMDGSQTSPAFVPLELRYLTPAGIGETT